MADEQWAREDEEEFSDGEIKAKLGGNDGEDSSDITLTPTPPASPPGAPFEKLRSLAFQKHGLHATMARIAAWRPREMGTTHQKLLFKEIWMRGQLVVEEMAVHMSFSTLVRLPNHAQLCVLMALAELLVGKQKEKLEVEVEEKRLTAPANVMVGKQMEMEKLAVEERTAELMVGKQMETLKVERITARLTAPAELMVGSKQMEKLEVEERITARLTAPAEMEKLKVEERITMQADVMVGDHDGAAHNTGERHGGQADGEPGEAHGGGDHGGRTDGEARGRDAGEDQAHDKPARDEGDAWWHQTKEEDGWWNNTERDESGWMARPVTESWPDSMNTEDKQSDVQDKRQDFHSVHGPDRWTEAEGRSESTWTDDVQDRKRDFHGRDHWTEADGWSEAAWHAKAEDDGQRGWQGGGWWSGGWREPRGRAIYRGGRFGKSKGRGKDTQGGEYVHGGYRDAAGKVHEYGDGRARKRTRGSGADKAATQRAQEEQNTLAWKAMNKMADVVLNRLP
ncbi:unnamed protein product [Effrenium voratum]|nr:unnamed protein product [Effrenium voratum]CAJ1446299.1 unnamed protein product [Effrenium voratum]CAJ1458529.1 unnamed protein product [Effrenium voratum]